MTTPPVPHWARLQYEERVREAVTGSEDVGTVCGAARDVTRLYPWATQADTANALINVMGVGYGAIYLHWAHKHTGRTPR